MRLEGEFQAWLTPERSVLDTSSFYWICINIYISMCMHIQLFLLHTLTYANRYLMHIHPIKHGNFLGLFHRRDQKQQKEKLKWNCMLSNFCNLICQTNNNNKKSSWVLPLFPPCTIMILHFYIVIRSNTKHPRKSAQMNLQLHGNNWRIFYFWGKTTTPDSC